MSTASYGVASFTGGHSGGTLSIGEYIHDFYNFQRRHSTIDYNSPVEFELMHSVKKAA